MTVPTLTTAIDLETPRESRNILDVCCGSKMFWFDKNNDKVVYGDVRREEHVLCDGRALSIDPEVLLDFTNLPFKDSCFKLVVFDPPHLINVGEKSWLAKKYGALGVDWKKDLTAGFSECFRVLEIGGVLIFKWSEVQIKVKDILALTSQQPLFGHKSGKRSNTHWFTFMKVGGE